jgi:ferredoxin
LIYGNRARASIIFREELNALKNRFIQRFALHYILSRELPDAPVYSGRINGAKCEALNKVVDFESMDGIYLCGPESMIFEIRDWLTSQGIDRRKIHFELFTAPESSALQATKSVGEQRLSHEKAGGGQHLVKDEAGEAQRRGEDETGGAQRLRGDETVGTPHIDNNEAGAAHGLRGDEAHAAEGRTSEAPTADNRKTASSVTVRLDGLSFNFDLPFDENTILDAALDAGADVPYSCKGGVCGTCRAKLTEGRVEMDINYALEPEEVAAGFILCCQSRPVTGKVIVDFDDK